MAGYAWGDQQRRLSHTAWNPNANILQGKVRRIRQCSQLDRDMEFVAASWKIISQANAFLGHPCSDFVNSEYAVIGEQKAAWGRKVCMQSTDITTHKSGHSNNLFMCSTCRKPHMFSALVVLAKLWNRHLGHSAMKVIWCIIHFLSQSKSLLMTKCLKNCRKEEVRSRLLAEKPGCHF